MLQQQGEDAEGDEGADQPLHRRLEQPEHDALHLLDRGEGLAGVAPHLLGIRLAEHPPEDGGGHVVAGRHDEALASPGQGEAHQRRAQRGDDQQQGRADHRRAADRARAGRAAAAGPARCRGSATRARKGRAAPIVTISAAAPSSISSRVSSELPPPSGRKQPEKGGECVHLLSSGSSADALCPPYREAMGRGTTRRVVEG